MLDDIKRQQNVFLWNSDDFAVVTAAGGQLTPSGGNWMSSNQTGMHRFGKAACNLIVS